MQIYTPEIFRAVIKNYFSLASLESALKFVDRRIVENGAAVMTPDIQFVFFDHLFNIDERTHPMQKAQQGRESYRTHLENVLFRTLLHSTLSSHEVRAGMFRYMLNPTSQLEKPTAAQAEIAYYFFLRGNIAEKAEARKILEANLYFPIARSTWTYVPTERVLASLAFVAAGEPYTSKGLASIEDFVMDPDIEGTQRISILESAIYYGVHSVALLHFFESRTHIILPTTLPKQLEPLYEPAAHGKILEEERANVINGIDQYRVAVEESCLRALTPPQTLWGDAL